MKETLAPLRFFPAFSHFDDGLFGRLCPAVALESLPAGARLFHVGEGCGSFFAVLDGAIELRRETPRGAVAVGLARRGDLVGDADYVTGEIHSCDARSDHDSEVVRLRNERLRALLERDPGLELPLYWALWKSLSAKLRGANGRLAGFFAPAAEAGDRPAEAPAAKPGDDVRIDLRAKRSLFEEQRLSAMEISFLSSLSREARYAPGEIIFEEGAPGDAMYIIVEGGVMISKHIPGAGEEALDFVGRGDYFGEMALIDDQPRSARARAHEEGAVVLSIPREVLAGILDIHRVSSLRLLKLLCSLVARRLRQSEEKLVGWHILAGNQAISLEVPL